MKITKENSVTVKNIYFVVTVFLVECILLMITSGIFIACKAIFNEVLTEGIYLLIVLTSTTITWYIAFNIGIYNIFQAKKIAKKNLKLLKKCLKKDWVVFTLLSILLLCSHDIYCMIGVVALFINYPLLFKIFDRTCKNHYKTI